MSRLISLVVLLASIVIIGALFYKVMIGFFVPGFLAAVLVVVFSPLHRWVTKKVGKQEHLAAGITTTLIIISVLLPTALIITMAAIQGSGLVSNINPSAISIGLNSARKKLALESPCQVTLRSIQKEVGDIQRVVGSSSMAEMADSKGEMAGLVKRIRVELDSLLPTLRKSIDADMKTELRLAREKSGDPRNFDEVAVEKALLEKADSHYDFHQEQWTKAIDQVKESLDRITNGLVIATAPSSPPVINGVENAVLTETSNLDSEASTEEVDIIELQARAVQLGTVWQNTREVILGGPILASLKDIANPSEDQIKKLTESAIEYLQPKLISVTGATAEFLIWLIFGSAIMIISMYFFLYDGPGMIRSLMKLSPLDDRYEMELLTEFDRIARAIVLAMIFSAIVQGLTAGIGYYFVGMPSLVLLTLLSVLCGLIPFVGPGVIWGPVCVYLAVYEERYWASGLLALWGVIAVGSVDNVVKAYVLHGQSQLHPLLALLSVLGGVQALGPIGIVVGPIIVVLLQTLLGILQREIMNMDAPNLPPEAALAVEVPATVVDATVTAPLSDSMNGSVSLDVAASPSSVANESLTNVTVYPGGEATNFASHTSITDAFMKWLHSLKPVVHTYSDEKVSNTNDIQPKLNQQAALNQSPSQDPLQ